MNTYYQKVFCVIALVTTLTGCSLTGNTDLTKNIGTPINIQATKTNISILTLSAHDNVPIIPDSLTDLNTTKYGLYQDSTLTSISPLLSFHDIAIRDTATISSSTPYLLKLKFKKAQHLDLFVTDQFDYNYHFAFTKKLININTPPTYVAIDQTLLSGANSTTTLTATKSSAISVTLNQDSSFTDTNQVVSNQQIILLANYDLESEWSASFPTITQPIPNNGTNGIFDPSIRILFRKYRRPYPDKLDNEHLRHTWFKNYA